MTHVILFLIVVTAFAAGAVYGVKFKTRHLPTTQEQIDAVMKLASPTSADDLLRLMEKRMVCGAGGVHEWKLSMSLNGMKIETPPRKHLVLLIADIPSFIAMVEAAEAIQPPKE